MMESVPVFESFVEAGLDVNASSNSATIDVADYREVTVQAVLASGAFSTAVLQAQCSADGTNFVDIAGKTTTGPGIIGEISVGTQYFRVRVSTTQGGAGTADITFNTKR